MRILWEHTRDNYVIQHAAGTVLPLGYLDPLVGSDPPRGDPRTTTRSYSGCDVEGNGRSGRRTLLDAKGVPFCMKSNETD